MGIAAVQGGGVTCLTCQHIGLKSSPAMAKLGFGHCKFDGVGVFKSIAYTCDQHAPAEKEIVAKREAWAAKNNERGE